MASLNIEKFFRGSPDLYSKKHLILLDPTEIVTHGTCKDFIFKYKVLNMCHLTNNFLYVHFLEPNTLHGPEIFQEMLALKHKPRVVDTGTTYATQIFKITDVLKEGIEFKFRYGAEFTDEALSLIRERLVHSSGVKKTFSYTFPNNANTVHMFDETETYKRIFWFHGNNERSHIQEIEDFVYSMRTEGFRVFYDPLGGFFGKDPNTISQVGFVDFVIVNTFCYPKTELISLKNFILSGTTFEHFFGWDDNPRLVVFAGVSPHKLFSEKNSFWGSPLVPVDTQRWMMKVLGYTTIDADRDARYNSIVYSHPRMWSDIDYSWYIANYIVPCERLIRRSTGMLTFLKNMAEILICRFGLRASHKHFDKYINKVADMDVREYYRDIFKSNYDELIRPYKHNKVGYLIEQFTQSKFVQLLRTMGDRDSDCGLSNNNEEEKSEHRLKPLSGNDMNMLKTLRYVNNGFIDHDAYARQEYESNKMVGRKYDLSDEYGRIVENRTCIQTFNGVVKDGFVKSMGTAGLGVPPVNNVFIKRTSPRELFNPITIDMIKKDDVYNPLITEPTIMESIPNPPLMRKDVIPREPIVQEQPPIRPLTAQEKLVDYPIYKRKVGGPKPNIEKRFIEIKQEPSNNNNNNITTEIPQSPSSPCLQNEKEISPRKVTIARFLRLSSPFDPLATSTQIVTMILKKVGKMFSLSYPTVNDGKQFTTFLNTVIVPKPQHYRIMGKFYKRVVLKTMKKSRR